MLMYSSVAAAQRINIVQAGDNRLSCSKIASQMVKMDKTIASTEESIQNSKNIRDGGDLAAQSGMGADIPFLGTVMGAVSRMSAGSEAKNRQLNAQAEARKQQLTTYFNQKGCSQKSYQQAKAKAENSFEDDSSGGGLFGGLFGSKKKSHTAISTRKLNVRQGPSTGNPVLGQLSPGEEVKVISTRNGWLQVSSNSAKGWVSAKYMRKIN